MAMNLGDAVLKITGDTKNLDQALNSMDAKLKSSMEKMSGQMRGVGVALTAAGAAGLAFVASARKMNAQLGQTGMTIGATTDEMRKLALSTTNVTFPLESVVKTFDILAKAGVRDQKVLKATAIAFDTLADATGSSAEVVAKQLVPAFKALGEDIPETAEELDKFTWLAKNTTVTIEEFGSVMAYVAQFGDDLNLTLDDMVAIMGVLESKGKSGSTATKMFRTALTQAANGTATLTDALGITAAEIDDMKVSIDGATGSTQEYADMANKQFGIMDKLKQKWSELTFQIGSYLTPLEPVLAGMTALGPLFLMLSTKIGIATVAWIAHTVAVIASTAATWAMTAAQWALNAAMTANPIGLVVIAVGALIAAGVLLVTEWEKVVDFFKGAWEAITEFAKDIIDPGRVKKSTEEVTVALERMAAARKNILAGLTETVKKELEDEKQARLDFERERQTATERQSEATRKALDDELSASRRVHNAKIAMLDFEYNAKIRTLNAGAEAEISGIQAQIDAIDQQTKDENQILREQERVNRLAELEAAVASATTAEDETRARIALADYRARVERERLLERRTAEKDALRESINTIRLAAQEEEERLRDELDAKKTHETSLQFFLENRLEREKEGLDIALTEAKTRLTEETKAINDEYAIRLRDAAVFAVARSRILMGGTTPPIPTPGPGFLRSIPGLQHGGIAMRPMVARIAERGPEAVIPLGRGGGFGTANITVLLDEQVLVQALGEPLVDYIRLQTAANF